MLATKQHGVPYVIFTVIVVRTWNGTQRPPVLYPCIDMWREIIIVCRCVSWHSDINCKPTLGPQCNQHRPAASTVTVPIYFCAREWATFTGISKAKELERNIRWRRKEGRVKKDFVLSVFSVLCRHVAGLRPLEVPASIIR
jgi:hypothetical protein